MYDCRIRKIVEGELMTCKLPDSFINMVVAYARGRETLANANIIAQCLQDHIWHYIDIFDEDQTPTDLMKAIFLGLEDSQTVTIKPYNIVFNLDRIWRQLPETLHEYTNLTTGSLPTDLFSLLAVATHCVIQGGLMAIELNKALETACLATAYLTWKKEPVSVDEIFTVCKALRDQSADFAYITRDELVEQLKILKALHCIKEVNSKYQSCEVIKNLNILQTSDS
jgi:hypothetical protein